MNALENFEIEEKRKNGELEKLEIQRDSIWPKDKTVIHKKHLEVLEEAKKQGKLPEEFEELFS